LSKTCAEWQAAGGICGNGEPRPNAASTHLAWWRVERDKLTPRSDTVPCFFATAVIAYRLSRQASRVAAHQNAKNAFNVVTTLALADEDITRASRNTAGRRASDLTTIRDTSSPNHTAFGRAALPGLAFRRRGATPY